MAEIDKVDPELLEPEQELIEPQQELLEPQQELEEQQDQDFVQEDHHVEQQEQDDVVERVANPIEVDIEFTTGTDNETDIEAAQVKKRRSVGSYKFKNLASCYQFGPWIKKQREAQCVFCNKRMAGSKPSRLAAHIKNCEQAPEEAKSIISHELSISKGSISPSSLPIPILNPDMTITHPDDSETNATTPKGRSVKKAKGRAGSSFSTNCTLNSIKKSGGNKTGSAHEEADKALSRLILSSRLPISVVECPYFRAFVQSMDPSYKLPSVDMIKVEVQRQRNGSK